MAAAKEEKKRVPSQVELRHRKFNSSVSDPRLVQSYNYHV